MNEKYVVEISPQGCGRVFYDRGIITSNAYRLVETPEEVALVVFTGGEDVTPSLYGENKGCYTYCSPNRDEYEQKMFEIAKKHNIPCVGICRGSQFLCVMAGGRLAQDITGHGRDHIMLTNDDRRIFCTSTHHQMQVPPKSAIPLAWAEPRLSQHYLDGNDEEFEVDREYEVVYYPNINAIGIQGHHEYSFAGPDFAKYSREMVKKYLIKE
jgi:GMP synthase-like glutamine amidotransferase